MLKASGPEMQIGTVKSPCQLWLETCPITGPHSTNVVPFPSEHNGRPLPEVQAELHRVLSAVQSPGTQTPHCEPLNGKLAQVSPGVPH
jgi:hypothetical protein